jgi:hypothetical protein
MSMDLDQILIKAGFEKCGTSETSYTSDPPSKVTNYHYYEEGWEGFIDLDYVEGIHDSEQWKKINPEGSNVIAEINMHTAFQEEIFEKAVEFGRMLRDHYGVILLLNGEFYSES